MSDDEKTANGDQAVRELTAALTAALDGAHAERKSGSWCLVVGVSGGEDSHVLLHLLQLNRERLPMRIYAVYVDHGLRPESAREAGFVMELAARYGATGVVERTPKWEGGENVEAWARRERYLILERIRESVGADLILTAHHQNDQSETLLHRAISGRLATEARGIAAFDPARHLLRPLLSVPKAQIEAYSAAFMLPFVCDSMNSDPQRMRSRVRHELLPMLSERFNPAIVASLAMVGERMADDERFLQLEAARARQTLGKRAKLEALLQLPTAIRWRVARLLAEEQVGEAARRIGYRQWSELIRLLEQESAVVRAYDLGFGMRATFGRREGLAFSPIGPSKSGEPERSPARPLSLPGEVERHYSDGSWATIKARVIELPEHGAERWDRLVESAVGFNPLGSVIRSAGVHQAREYFDMDSLGFLPLQVRERQEGDRMRVWKRGERKLKKLFLERGLMLTLRDRIPIVQAGSDIIWVPGIARSELAPVSAESRRVVELSYLRSRGGLSASAHRQ